MSAHRHEKGEMLAAEPFQSLLDAARSGAEWAWSRLVEAIDGTLRGYVRRQGGMDPDDLVGETWLHVARGIHRFEGDQDGFRSWVFMIAHHRIIDERRRRRRKPEELQDREMLDRVGLPARSAESQAIERLEHEDLQGILDQLSAEQREVLLLRFVGGFGVSEIADIVGKKPGAVQALQRRAFARLKKNLETGSTRSLGLIGNRGNEAFDATP
jgi:RNA polymerase sigma-70 factor (ECF subfamily)